MTGGYTGKILRLNLTNRTVSTIDTSKYEQWGGGNGIGGAIFWDLAVAPGLWDLRDGFDPKNVITLMTSPLTKTLTPWVGGRLEIQGVGVDQYPIGWFTRSNMGGRFADELKGAGWDGIVLEGKASSLTWIKIVNDQVTFEDAEADGLKGEDTWETQVKIFGLILGQRKLGEWLAVGDGYSTQMPAVIAIGLAGENLSRIACLIHDAGCAAGQCGFGGIFGSKNLKAISVQGTGSVKVADPKALIDTRLWLHRERPGGLPSWKYAGSRDNRMSACAGCPTPDHGPVRRNGILTETHCYVTGFHYDPARFKINSDRAADLVQRAGINCVGLLFRHRADQQDPTYMVDHFGGVDYLDSLYRMGIIGPGKAIDSWPLDFENIGTWQFASTLLRAISERKGIGDDLAEGIALAAKKWGRLEEDLDSGLLPYPVWGQGYHHTLPGVEWPYSSILSERDVNVHPYSQWYTKEIREKLPAEKIVEMITDQMEPYEGDPFMLDYTWQGDQAFTTGVYSQHKAKYVAWERHYHKFYNNSLGWCDASGFTAFINTNATAGDNRGIAKEVMTRCFNAVTGKNMTYADGMEIGRKIWNRDRAIWILQGRHRDVEKLSGYLFKPGASRDDKYYPVYHPDGTWTIERESLKDMYLDKDGFEQFKTHFYELEGWDTSSGWPKRSTLEGLGLGFVADELERKGKLGSG